MSLRLFLGVSVFVVVVSELTIFTHQLLRSLGLCPAAFSVFSVFPRTTHHQHDINTPTRAHTQDRFEGHGGEGGEAFNKPTSRTFSRRSLLQAREESIALGHATRFKETFEKNNNRQQGSNSSAGAGVGRLNRKSSGQSEHEADDGPVVAPEGGELDTHVFLSRHSWGSASSARRRHNAAVRERAVFGAGAGRGGARRGRAGRGIFFCVRGAGGV